MSVAKEFRQIEWDAEVEDDCRHIVRLAVREDLDRLFDWTTLALVPSETRAAAAIVSRQAGTVAGLRAARLALGEMDRHLVLEDRLADGSAVSAGETFATLEGPARSLLTAERIVLNFIGHLSGIATATRRFVDAVAGTRAKIYDTRKTTPAWRRLEKYAVRMGGGHNHRTGLFDAILIKDNHLAVAARAAVHLTLEAAVRRAREFSASLAESRLPGSILVEVEVDTLDQLKNVLIAAPDIVLLDNMSADSLSRAVALRDERAPQVELEASGGISLANVAEIARTGVDRISIGALTHSSASLDVGLDWQ